MTISITSSKPKLGLLLVIFLLCANYNLHSQSKLSLNLGTDIYTGYKNERPLASNLGYTFKMSFRDVFQWNRIKISLSPKIDIAYNYKKGDQFLFSYSRMKVITSTIYPRPECACDCDTLFPPTAVYYTFNFFKFAYKKSIPIKKIQLDIIPNVSGTVVKEEQQRARGCTPNPLWPTYHEKYFTYENIYAKTKLNFGYGLNVGVTYKRISLQYWAQVVAKQHLLSTHLFQGFSTTYSIPIIKNEE